MLTTRSPYEFLSPSFYLYSSFNVGPSFELSAGLSIIHMPGPMLGPQFPKEWRGGVLQSEEADGTHERAQETS
jgi:hypothetical protein